MLPRLNLELKGWGDICSANLICVMKRLRNAVPMLQLSSTLLLCPRISHSPLGPNVTQPVACIVKVLRSLGTLQFGAYLMILMYDCKFSTLADVIDVILVL